MIPDNHRKAVKFKFMFSLCCAYSIECNVMFFYVMQASSGNATKKKARASERENTQKIGGGVDESKKGQLCSTSNSVLMFSLKYHFSGI